MKCVFSHKVMHLDFVGRDGFFLLFIYIFLKVSNWLKFPNFHLLSFDFFNGGTEHSGTSQEDKNLNAGSRVKASTVCSCSPQSTCSGKETYQGNSTVICASCLFPYSLLFQQLEVIAGQTASTSSSLELTKLSSTENEMKTKFVDFSSFFLRQSLKQLMDKNIILSIRKVLYVL